MQTRSVTIVDEEIEACGEVLNKMCTKLQDCLDVYVEILNDTRSKAVKSGEVADALSAFAAAAASLKGFAELGSTLQQTLENFASESKNADQYLY